MPQFPSTNTPVSSMGLLPGMRAGQSPQPLDGPPGQNGQTPSFSSVLREQANRLNKPESRPAESAGTSDPADDADLARTDTARVAAEPAPAPSSVAVSGVSAITREDDDLATESAPPAAVDVAPIAAVMVQMTPAALVAAVGDSESLAGGVPTDTAVHGAIVRELAQGHGQAEKNADGNHGLSLALGHTHARPDAQPVAATPVSATGSDAATQLPAEQLPPGLVPAALEPAEQVRESLPDTRTAAVSATPARVSTAATDEPESQAPAAALALAESPEIVPTAPNSGTTGMNEGGDTAPALETFTATATTAKAESSFNQALSLAREGQSAVGAAFAGERPGGAEPAQHIRAPVGHPNWSTELGDKMTWMVTNQRQQAELVLNPPQLGRIEVSLTVNGDQANAVFTSPNAAVREMLENSLPRLREILAGSGLNLGQADVGAQAFAQQQQAQDGRRSGSGMRPDTPPGIDTAISAGGTVNLGRAGERRGMVDIFA